MEIGFIGLGQMGRHIAANLARAGHDLWCCDSSAAARDAYPGAAVRLTGDISDLAGLPDGAPVFLCLPHGKAVSAVLTGDGGLAGHLRPGARIIDLSTIDRDVAVGLHEQLEGRGLRFMDAPISGMEARARDGTLTVMAGGPADLFDEVRPLFETFATTILHMGGPGAGQLTKLINQLLLDINAAAIAEVLPMAVKLGLDTEKVVQVINTGTGRSFASEFFLPRILKGSFGDGYPMQAAYKDLVGAAGLSARHGIPMPVLAAATATYQQALLKGLGPLDKGAMVQVFEDLLQVKVRSASASED